MQLRSVITHAVAIIAITVCGITATHAANEQNLERIQDFFVKHESHISGSNAQSWPATCQEEWNIALRATKQAQYTFNLYAGTRRKIEGMLGSEGWSGYHDENSPNRVTIQAAKLLDLTTRLRGQAGDVYNAFATYQAAHERLLTLMLRRSHTPKLQDERSRIVRAYLTGRTDDARVSAEIPRKPHVEKLLTAIGAAAVRHGGAHPSGSDRAAYEELRTISDGEIDAVPAVAAIDREINAASCRFVTPSSRGGLTAGAASIYVPDEDIEALQAESDKWMGYAILAVKNRQSAINNHMSRALPQDHQRYMKHWINEHGENLVQIHRREFTEGLQKRFASLPQSLRDKFVKEMVVIYDSELKSGGWL